MLAELTVGLIELNNEKTFYTTSPLAVVVFSFATAGLFNMYYYFKNFRVQSERSDSDPADVVKGILYPLFCLDLLKQAESSTSNYKGISVKVIFIIQIIFVFGASILTGPFKLIGYFTFIPMLAANKLFQSANETQSTGNHLVEFKSWHYVLGVLGCVLVVYMMTTYF